VGIIRVRPGEFSVRGSAMVSVSVGAARSGKNSAPPGVVVSVRPDGEVKTRVPSENCCSDHPLTPHCKGFQQMMLPESEKTLH